MLKKRMDELEQQMRQSNRSIRSLLYKPNIKTRSIRLGPPKGHKANHRPRPNHADETINLALCSCPHCNNELGRVTQVKERFIEDIQPATPHVRKYLISWYYCTKCRKQVHPTPPEIPRCRFGLNLLILITFLRYGMRLPMNRIARQLAICYQLSMSEGTIVNELNRFADYLGPEFDRIKREVRELSAVNVDETGWRVNGESKWLWDFITEKHDLLLVRDNRAKSVVREVLGEHYNGVVTSDCLKTYDTLPYRMQKCWAHLLRDTRKRDNREGRIMLESLKHLNRLAKSGEFDKEDMLHMTEQLVSKEWTDPWCVNITKRLDRFRHEWFTFMEHEGVDDTNNAAERGVRPSVVIRKISGGNRSVRGARNHEIVMSVMQTWEKQGIDFMEASMETITGQLT